MPIPNFSGNPPSHLITEPLRSFTPLKLSNGDLRMAIAVAGQHAYNSYGEEATLTEEFLSKDFKTWESGLISTNHENTNDLLGGATLYDLEYDSEKKLVIASFANLPDLAKKLIQSEFYQGLSQECIPLSYQKNSFNVIKGYGTGVTIVMWPHSPAATPKMGVGIRPELAAILASKYPSQVEDTMTEKTGGGTPAISTEAYESIALEKVELKSQIQTLESEKSKLETELASTRKEFTDYKSGEADRTKVEIEKALRAYDAEVKSQEALNTAIKELKSVISEKDAEVILSTNPSVETINSFVAVKKVELSIGVGSGINSSTDEGSEDIARLVSELRGTQRVVKLGN